MVYQLVVSPSTSPRMVSLSNHGVEPDEYSKYYLLYYFYHIIGFIELPASKKGNFN